MPAGHFFAERALVRDELMIAIITGMSRRNADFDEIIRGYREVEITTTGEKTTGPLGDADAAVEILNAGGGSQFNRSRCVTSRAASAMIGGLSA